MTGMNRFSANLGFLWAELSMLERIERAAAEGFGAVEMHWPYAEDPKALRAACAAAGVELLALNTPLGNTEQGDFGLAALAGREAAFRDGFLMAAEYAVAAGASKLHVMAGVGPNNARTRQIFAQNLLWAEAQAPELTLLLEPLNNFDKPQYFYHLPEHALAIINSADLQRTKLMFDAYHVGREGYDPVREYDRCAPFIGHIQIAGVPHRHEPYSGQVDFERFLTHLAAQNYTGWVGCEYKPERGEEAGMARLRQLSDLLLPID